MNRITALRWWIPGLLLVVGISAQLVILPSQVERAKERVKEQVMTRARTIGALAAANIESSERRHDRATARSLVAHLSGDPAIEHVWLVDGRGAIRWSSDVASAGSFLQPSFAGAAELARAARETVAPQVVATDDRVTGAFPLLLATRTTWPPRDVGVLIVRYDIRDQTAAAIAEARQSALFQGALILALVIAIYLTLRWRVIRRLQFLAVASDALASGDHSARSGVDGSDEIGWVAATFDHMAGEIEAQQRQLRASEERLRTLLATQSDAVLVVDRDGTLAFASAAAADIFDGAREGHRLTDLVGPTSRGELDAALAKVWESGERRAVTVEAPDGEGRRVVEIAFSRPARIEDVGGVVASARDVTAQRRTAEKIHTQKKMEAVGQLAGGVAHDFNNLLTVVTLNSSALLGGMLGGPAARELLEDIRRAADRGKDLNQQLLTFGGRSFAKREPVDLVDATRRLERMLVRLLPENIRMRVESSRPQLWSEVNRGQIEQVILNLCLNARDAMPDGGQLLVRVAARDGHDGEATLAIIEVEDTGVGMSDEVKSRIFEPFFTTKELGRGTGLGLATVYRIVEEHGGELQVTSAPGSGSVLRVALAACAAPSDTALSEHGGSDHEDAVVGDARLLIVEDEPMLRSALERALGMRGYQVSAFPDGEAALAALESDLDAFDVLVSDLMLPGINGLEVVERARSLRPSMPAVIMTGYADDDEVRGRVDASEVQVLDKPFTPGQLAHVVNDLCEPQRTAVARDTLRPESSPS